MTRTADDWYAILFTVGVREPTALAWAPACAQFLTDDNFALGDEEIEDFLGQVVYESGNLEHLEENLNYRAERLMQVWPTRFKTLEMAKPYAGNPAALAERVYGGRMGNDEPGDGLRYRGRGLLMLTGKDNYEAAQAATGLPLVDKPELAAQPAGALQTAIAWWNKNIPDSIVGNVELITRRVNGGSTGLPSRIKLTDTADAALKETTA